MDNITRSNLINKSIKILDITFVVVGTLADLLGVLSFILSLFPNAPTLIKLDNITWHVFILLALVNIALLVRIYSYYAKRQYDMEYKAGLLIEGFDKISMEFENYFYYLESEHNTPQTASDPYRIVAESTKSIIDKVELTLRKATNKEIRACVKYFPQKYTKISDMQLITLCRSDESLDNSRAEHDDLIWVKENTDFELIMTDKYPYFAYNDLSKFKQQMNIEYKNSSDDWKSRYNATIVHPIKKRERIVRRKEFYDILGFLCVDSLSLDAFSGPIGPLCVKFVQSVSRLLYIFLDKCTVYMDEPMEPKASPNSSSPSPEPVLSGSVSE